MPRRPKFSEAQILDATATLVAAGGPGAATIGAIGQRLDAPSGSIYHRFASRDVLLGRLWLGKAAFFQDRFFAALAHRDPRIAGLEAALSLPRSVRADLTGARIMLLHRREDFLSQDWPADMKAEAVRLEDQIADSLEQATHRLFGAVTPLALRRTRFAVFGVPFAAVRGHVAANEMPPADVDDLIATAYRALIQRAPPSPA